MNTLKIKMILALLLVAGISEVYAQKGRVAGTIIDNSSGEPLMSATVSITGTTRGVLTDLDGNYVLDNLDEGTYSISVSYITYTTKHITGVVVRAGQTTTLNITLDPEVAQLGEVTISADAILNNDAAMLRHRQRSVAFSDVISAESISKLSSSDAAGVMSKVVGASVVDGKYVYVRGLGDRYTSTQLNGASLPSADPNKQSFQMDIIPSNLLNNIVTLKTFTPDKPGSFSGGLVDVATKEFPDRLTVSLSASTSYNSNTSFNDVILPDNSGKNWLGFDNGSRKLPEILSDPSVVIPFEIQSRFNADNAAQLHRVSTAFNNEMAPELREIPMNRSYSFSAGNQFQLLGKTVGYVASLNYSQSYSAYNNGNVGRWDLIGPISQAQSLQAVSDYQDSKGTQEVDLSGYAMISMRINPSNKFSVSYLNTRNASNTGRYLHGFAEEIPNDITESRVIEYVERSLNNVQLKGTHTFTALRQLSLAWQTSFSENTQSEPDVRYLLNYYRVLPDGSNFYSIASGIFPRPSRAFRELSETNQSYSADLTYPFKSFNNNSASFKIGGLYSSNERDFSERRFNYLFNSQAPRGLNSFAPNFNDYFSYVGVVDTVGSRFVFGNYIQNALSLKNNYTAEMEVSAGYAMLELPVTDWLKLVGGARLEHAIINAVSADTTLTPGKLDNRDVLPSVNFIFAVNEKMNIRVAYTHTVARPSYRELTPYETVDFSGDFVFSGNAQLRRTMIRNYDVRWEWFTGSGEIIAVSGFYKDFDNPIERVFDVKSAKKITVQNVPSATVMGLEFEVRKSLSTFSDVLRHFSVSSNLTLVQSQVKIPADELFIIRNNDPEASDSRPLSGQSPYIINADLSYFNENIGLSADLSYNVFGERLSAIALGAAPDVFERPMHLLNFTTRKTLVRNFNLSLSARNLLDARMTQSQKLANGSEYIYSAYSPGRTFSLGINYQF